MHEPLEEAQPTGPRADDGTSHRPSPPTGSPDASRNGLGGSQPRLLQDVVDSIPDGVVVADRNGRFLHFNPAAERILGLGPLGVPVADWSLAYGCFCEDGVTPLPSDELPLARAMRGDTVFDFPLFVRNRCVPEGVWLSIDASPLKDDTGALIGGIVVFRDVTEKRREHPRIELLSWVVEQTADMVVITDRDGLIEYVNAAVERTTGFAASELIGRTPRAFRSGAHDNAFYDDLWATLSAGQVYRGTIINRKKNGDTFHSEQTITPIRDATGNVAYFVSVGRDMTDRRRAEAQESRHLLARAVQQRLLPAVPPSVCGFKIGGAVYTADKTGGDYIDFIPLPDFTTGVVVGDVSGHAFDAALVMAQTRAFLRSIAQTTADPGTILTRVNRALVGDIAENQFVTLVFACLHEPSRTLRYASAGHPAGHVLDRSGVSKCELPSTGIPLGMFAETTYETAPTTPLEEDDLVVFFTDGVTEAENGDGTHFGAARALDVIRSAWREPAAKIVHRVYRAVRDFGGRRPQDDDITAVVCRVARGEPPNPGTGKRMG
jgi:sigma-B regulation protein RsbU (phosphoserine phosphatase)